MKTNYPEESKVDQANPQFNILEKVKKEYKNAELLRESIAREGVAVPAPIPMGPAAFPASSRGRAIEEIEEAKKQSKRIETKTSNTALKTCLARAISFFENRHEYRSGDYIAPMFLPRFVRTLIKIEAVRNFITSKFPKGLYEYTIARTKYIDSVFEDSMRDGFQQVVILGAGFDTRGIRFCRAAAAAKTFELDAPITQKDKIRRLGKLKIDAKNNIIFVPLDLDKDSAASALARHRFQDAKKTLFLLEGVLPLLTADAVNSIFEFLKSSSGRGSEVVFDYVHKSVLHRENLLYGEKEAYTYVKKVGEPIVSGMDHEEMKAFLSRFGFSVRQIMDSERLNKTYFSEENVKRTGVVNESLCIVRAGKT